MSWYLKYKDSKSQLIESPRKEENWSEDKPEATEEPTKSKDKNRSKSVKKGWWTNPEVGRTDKDKYLIVKHEKWGITFNKTSWHESTVWSVSLPQLLQVAAQTRVWRHRFEIAKPSKKTCWHQIKGLDNLVESWGTSLFFVSHHFWGRVGSLKRKTKRSLDDHESFSVKDKSRVSCYKQALMLEIWSLCFSVGSAGFQ